MTIENGTRARLREDVRLEPREEILAGLTEPVTVLSRGLSQRGDKLVVQFTGRCRAQRTFAGIVSINEQQMTFELAENRFAELFDTGAAQVDTTRNEGADR